jgi:hypothetical protein
MSAVYYIEHASYGCGDGATFHIHWNGATMIVNLDQIPFPDATENILIERYTHACACDNEDTVDEIQDEILDAVVKVGAATFDKLAPPLPPTTSDLHSVLFPQQYSFRLVTVRGMLELLLEGTYRLKTYDSPRIG